MCEPLLLGRLSLAAEANLELAIALHAGDLQEHPVAALDKFCIEAVGIGPDDAGLVAPMNLLAVEPDRHRAAAGGKELDAKRLGGDEFAHREPDTIGRWRRAKLNALVETGAEQQAPVG